MVGKVSVRALLRLAAYFGLTLSLLPLQIVAHFSSQKMAGLIPVYYHRACLRIFGVRLHIEGTPVARNCLFVCNHVSTLDIPVLGAVMPLCFVAKAEVANWPLFGLLAKLQRTLFIERRSSKAVEHQNALIQRLHQGDNLVLFPEGTTSDGCRVLPFRTSLFQAVLGENAPGDVVIQPVSLVCSGENGLPADRFSHRRYAWDGDIALLPHLYMMASNSRTDITLTFHSVLRPADFSDRRLLAQTAQDYVHQGVVGR